MDIQTNQLKKDLKGTLIQPGDHEYMNARRVYNAMIDKRPAMIAQCTDVNDVVTCVSYARKYGLEIAVRSGGHHGAGLGICEGGLVIDLSPMKAIEIDPDTGTAIIQPGNLLSDIDRATHEYGLALPFGIISTTGIGGLTLGGGIGYLTRKAGLTIDRLLEARIVLASGEVVTCNNNENADLFWAIRGGGGNFGIVISFTFSLIQVKYVYAGPMFWPLEKAGEAMRFFDETIQNAPHDLNGFFAFLTVPPTDPFPSELRNKKVCGVVWCYSGPVSNAEEIFKPIREFGPAILDFVGEMPLPILNSMFDSLYPPGYQWYWRGQFIKEFTDDFIRENLKFGSITPTIHSTVHFYPINGKVHEIAPQETAWVNRSAGYSMVIVGVSPDPEEAGIITDWCKSYFEAMKPHASGGSYVNFLMEEGEERIKRSYDTNYERLQTIKDKYDPRNLFHINQNIKPLSL